MNEEEEVVEKSGRFAKGGGGSVREEEFGVCV